MRDSWNYPIAEGDFEWIFECNCEGTEQLRFYFQKEVVIMVELDQFKFTLSTYTEPLKEVGDSL